MPKHDKEDFVDISGFLPKRKQPPVDDASAEPLNIEDFLPPTLIDRVAKVAKSVQSAVGPVAEKGRTGLRGLVGDKQFTQQNPLLSAGLRLGDLITHFGSMLPAAAAGTVAGGAEAIDKEDITKFPEAFAATTEMLILDPTFESTAKASEIVGKGAELLGNVRKVIGQTVYEATGETETAAALATGAEVLAAGAFFKIFFPKRGGKDTEKAGSKESLEGEFKEIKVEPIKPDEPMPKLSDVQDLVAAEKVFNETKPTATDPITGVTRAVETLTDVERGHISRAQRIMEQQGLSYGEAIKQVVDSTTRPERFQHLVPRKGSRDLQIGEDTRSFHAMKATVFKDRPLAEVKSVAELDGTRVLQPIIPDINIVRRDFSSMVAPHKFVGDLHPVLKWIVDKIDRADRNVTEKSNRIAWGMELTQRKFGSARRVSVPTKTSSGGLTVYERLPLKDQITVKRDLQESSTNKVEMTVPDMEAKGWTPDMVKAGQALYRAHKAIFLEINGAAEATGGTGIKPLAGYINRIWEGDFRVFVRDADGKLMDTYGFSTRPGAQAFMRRLKKEDPTFSSSLNSLKRKKPGALALDAFQEAIRATKTGSPEASALKAAVERIVQSRGFGKHRIKRKNVGGYMGEADTAAGVRDFIKATETYIEGGVRYAENMRAVFETNKVLIDRDMVKAWPNTLQVAQRFRQSAMGAEGAIDKVIGDWTRTYFGETAVPRALGTVNQLTLISKLFMWNGRFLAAQGIQPFQMIPAKLINLKGQGYSGSVSKSIAQAIKSMVAPDAGAAASIRFAVKNGSITPKFVKELQDVLVSNKTSWMTGDIAGLLTGQRLAGRIEEYSRMQANLMFYHFLRNSGVQQRTAIESAAYLTDKYMVEYSAVARPMIYGSQGLGAIGKPMGLFKTFQHNWLAQAVEHVKAAGEGKPAGLGVFVGSNVMTAGLIGIVGLSATDELLRSMGMTPLSTLILRNEVSPILTWGVPSAALNMDLTTTLAAPGLGLGDFLSVPGYEYIGGILYEGGSLSKKYYSSLDWGVKKATGTVTPLDRMRFWKQVAPSSLQSAVEKFYTNNDGITPHPMKRGRGTFRRTSRDWVARYFSARSLEEARIIKSIWQLTRLEDVEQDRASALVDMYAAALGKGEDPPDLLFDEAEKIELSARDLHRRGLERWRSTSNTMLEQFTNFERSKRGRLRAERLGELGVTDQEEDTSPIDITNFVRRQP